MSQKYYTKSGERIRNPEAYARTGAPMYKTKLSYPGGRGYRQAVSDNINKPTSIYKLDLNNGKKYIGKTADMDRRMEQHFSGNGSRVTKKFAPQTGQEIDSCPGYFANELEQYHTEKNIEKYGYDRVRGGSYCNSKTLKKEEEEEEETTDGEEEEEL